MPKSNSPNKTKRNNSSSRSRSSSRSSSRSPNRSKTEKKPVKRCNKMPAHRIDNIIKFEKRRIDEASNQNRSPGYYEKMKKRLESLCFPKDTNWENTGTYFVALSKAI